MNEKISKKVGEAHAFSVVFAGIFNKTPGVVKELLGEHSDSVIETTSQQISELGSIIDEEGVTEIVTTKSEKTSNKISEMGEFYVGDDWDDSAEVLEWLSFFLGAAVIHWQLVVGAAKEMDNPEFERITEEGADYYATLLNVARRKAEDIGKERAQG